MSDPVVLTAALTGPIASIADNPHLPITPDQIAEAAEGAWRAGAAVVHVHLRDSEGRPTADLETGRRTIEAIALRCPPLIQLSTGVGLEVPFAERAALIELRPRMATLNLATMTFGSGVFLNPWDDVRRLAARMRELGVAPELEVYDGGHLELAMRLYEEDLLAEPLRFSVVMGVHGGMAARAANLLSFVERLPEGAIWQTVAIGRHNLTMTALGLALGGNARTGMEDTLLLRRGVPASSNAQLVERLARLAQAMEREPLDPVSAAAALAV
jgi:uncharacterized protein (DUF849 family)